MSTYDPSLLPPLDAANIATPGDQLRWHNRTYRVAEIKEHRVGLVNVRTGKTLDLYLVDSPIPVDDVFYGNANEYRTAVANARRLARR